MKDAIWYLEKYGESHRHPTNVLIHKIFVPLIMFSVIGLLWAVPKPKLFLSFPLMNFGMLLVATALIFYISMGVKIFFGMILIISPIVYGNVLLQDHPHQLSIMAGIFVFSWIMQFVGHKIEGKKPSFLEDLLFLLVGPVWVFYPIYKKIGLV
tara:strand:+ start:90 stop:548 length:459 start_codon:yes stop_codon:yes gene_type:complete